MVRLHNVQYLHSYLVPTDPNSTGNANYREAFAAV